MPASAPIALVFDTFGTVVDWRSSVISELETLGRARNVTADWPAFADAWRGEYGPNMNRVRKGELPWTQLDDLHRMALDKLVAQFGIEGLAEADLVQLNKCWHRLKPWPDSVPGLTRLKNKFIIGPLSNGNVSLLLNMAKNAQIPWDMIFGSDLWGHFKPDPETYLGVARMLDIPPGRVMMCAAHNYDLAAAKALGLMTGFFPRPLEKGPGAVHNDLEAKGDWDVVAKDIEDLATQLEC